MTHPDSAPVPQATADEPAPSGVGPEVYNHYGYRHLVAWCLSCGATSRFYVQEQIALARRDQAPAHAVYKTSVRSRIQPGTWITVDQLAPEDRERVEAYAKTMEHREQGTEEETPAPSAVTDFHYTLRFPAMLDITVTAPTLVSAYDTALRENRQRDGQVRIPALVEGGRTWAALFDSSRGQLVSSSDPSMRDMNPTPAHAPPAQPLAVQQTPRTTSVVLRLAKPDAKDGTQEDKPS